MELLIWVLIKTALGPTLTLLRKTQPPHSFQSEFCFGTVGVQERSSKPPSCYWNSWILFILLIGNGRELLLDYSHFLLFLLIWSRRVKPFPIKGHFNIL